MSDTFLVLFAAWQLSEVSAPPAVWRHHGRLFVTTLLALLLAALFTGSASPLMLLLPFTTRS